MAGIANLASRPKVFLSYRRNTGSDRAVSIRQYLENRGCEVFLDHTNLGGGHFDEQIIEKIQNCTHFILILFPTDLERCRQAGDQDWITREATAALQNQNCTVIPVVQQGFVWPEASDLPESMRDLSRNNQITWSTEYFQASLQKIEDFVKGRLVSSQTEQPNIVPGIAEAQVQNDFRVLSKHVNRLADIIENMPRFLTKWPEIMEELLDTRERNDVLSTIPSRSSNRIQINAVLETWIDARGNQATFNRLVSVLQSRRVTTTADHLEEIREELMQMI